jgi:hypothetical protein
MLRLPPFLRSRTRVQTQTELDGLNRLSAAYKQTFMHPNGEVAPHAQTVLADLARACMFADETPPRTADEAMVRASLHALYSRILRLTSLRSDDVTLIPSRTRHD